MLRVLLLVAFAVLPAAVRSAQVEPAPAPAAFVTKTKVMNDGVTMTADLYAADPATKAAAKPDAHDVVVVCMHMARSSRGEYRAIAPELAALGCTVLAVDLRSGEKNGGVENETAKSAAKGLGGTQGFAASCGDVAFAVDWARELVPGARVALVGSSFSSVLALRYAASEGSKVDLVLAFSPGDFIDDWKAADDAKRERVPVLVACGSGPKERPNAEPVANALPDALRTTFFAPPEWKAPHGASLLAVKDAAQKEAAWAPVKKLLHELATR